MPSSKRKAIARLQKAVDRVSELEQLSPNSSAFHNWHRDVRVTVLNTFGEDSYHINEFLGVKYRPRSTYAGNPMRIEILHNYYITMLRRAFGILQSMLDEVKDYWDDDEQGRTTSNTVTSGWTNTNEVFLVHGSDDGIKQTVARFLEQLNLKPIILHEQPNRGRTIIEKFEQNSQVPFAVVLLTPDDVGALKADERKPKPRARQNVVFELGYFTGSLGRDRVSALTKGSIEIPSDYHGVVYIAMEREDWRENLARELQAAGFGIYDTRIVKE